MKMCRLLRVDSLVRYMCKYHNGLIVGSGAQWLIGETDKTPRDFDVIIPPSEWAQACRSIPRGSLTNSFGGVCIEGERNKIDLWCGDIQEYFACLPAKDLPRIAYNPDKKLILRFETFDGPLP